MHHNSNLQLVGEVKKTWKKYADITWLKNNEPWDPKSDGKERFNGFTIRYASIVVYSMVFSGFLV